MLEWRKEAAGCSAAWLSRLRTSTIFTLHRAAATMRMSRSYQTIDERLSDQVDQRIRSSPRPYTRIGTPSGTLRTADRPAGSPTGCSSCYRTASLTTWTITRAAMVSRIPTWRSARPGGPASGKSAVAITIDKKARDYKAVPIRPWRLRDHRATWPACHRHFRCSTGMLGRAGGTPTRAFNQVSHPLLDLPITEIGVRATTARRGGVRPFRRSPPCLPSEAASSSAVRRPGSRQDMPVKMRDRLRRARTIGLDDGAEGCGWKIVRTGHHSLRPLILLFSRPGAPRA